MGKIEIDEIHYTDYNGKSYIKAQTEYPIYVSLIIEDIGSSIEFVALWIERPSIKEQNIDFSQFKIGDYRITNFFSYSKGHGTLLHDFLRNKIKERLNVDIINIYSSKRSGIKDLEVFLNDAHIFWEKRVEKQLAIFDSALDRYKILFKD